MGVGMFVGVWIARYLGPQQFGLLNYAAAFSALFGAFSALGLDRIVVRDLVKHPEQLDVFLGSAFGLKLVGGFLTILITVAAITLIRPGEMLILWLVGLSAAGFIFQSLNVIDFHFQAQVRSKYTVYASNAAFLLAVLIKIVLLLSNLPLITFAGAGLAEVALASFFLIIAYQCDHQRIRDWKFEGTVAWKQLRDSWPLILSSLAIMIYMRIDQVMIGQMLGDHAVGIFSAAVRISEVWYFIPTAIAGSVYPTLILTKTSNEKLYYQRLQKLFDMLTLLSLSVAVVITFISPYVVHILYGARYAASADVLALHIWAGVFVSLGAVSGIWFMAEKLQKYAYYRTFGGAVINVVLNLYMIPTYGPKGAAIATIISQGCAFVFFNALSSKIRPIFVRQMKSFLLYRLVSKAIVHLKGI